MHAILRTAMTCAGAVLLGASGIAGAAAAPATLAWSAYLYAVPGRPAQVLDQLDRNSEVDLLGCESGWCRVRVGNIGGYIAQQALRPEPAPTAWPAPSAACFVAGQVGHDALVATRFCPPPPAP